MKTRLKGFSAWLCFVCLSFTFTACHKEREDLRIDIASGFQNDAVTIRLDKETVFSGNVSTKPIAGYAERLYLPCKPGKREITVNVNGIEKKAHFKHKRESYVYIDYDHPSSKITITSPK